MRLGILTTDSTHHAHFVHALANAGLDLAVVVETNAVAPPFETAHPFEVERDAYERTLWFGGRDIRIEHAAERVLVVGSANEAESIAFLQRHDPRLLVVFGTGKIRGELLGSFADRIVNLHGGNPEAYRGLDSHLWATYHRDFANLVTTLHVLDAELDNGPILAMAEVPLSRGMPIEHLRASNTELCTKLVLAHCRELAAGADPVARPQRSRGRYYSAMPAVLKTLCRRYFAAHTCTP